jgi:ankyrin repeat protein
MKLALKELLEKVADTVEFGDIDHIEINSHGMFKNTPLHVVISWRDPAALKTLLENGAVVDAKGESGFTPLQHAIMMKNHQASIELLSHGADPRIENDRGDDAFAVATNLGDEDAIDLLRRWQPKPAH